MVIYEGRFMPEYIRITGTQKERYLPPGTKGTSTEQRKEAKEMRELDIKANSLIEQKLNKVTGEYYEIRSLTND